MERLVIWFSCGAASAVTAKICLSKYAGIYDMKVVRIVVDNEHEDNDRFAEDCEKWFRVPIVNLKSDKYKDCWDVWEKKRYLAGISGAPCTLELKKKVRLRFEQEWFPDFQTFGYTSEEKKRVSRFQQENPEINLLTPLIDENLGKNDCLAIVENAGIKLPKMYELGFMNNNCIGCVKGGAGYWNKIRDHFPETFDRMSKLERCFNHAILKNRDYPIFLDELSPDMGRHYEPEIECSLFCYQADYNYELTK